MRCPKCGYISFDHLESCKKCNKNISEAAADLDGTVFAVASPAFLNFEYEETGGQVEEEKMADSFADEENNDDAEETMDLSFEADDEDEIVMDLDVDGELNELAETDDESTLTLDDFEEIALDDEITLDFGGEEETLEPKSEEDTDGGLQLDFGDIDISDLAPPEENNDELVPETLTLEEETSKEAALAGGPAPVSASVALGSGLEDLQVEDLDLDTPAPLVAGSKAGDKLMPSVKTGTALDDFEIDLGELRSGDK